MIYLDNAATTAVSEDVLSAMSPYFTEAFGNPGSAHNAGFAAKKAVKDARGEIASFIGADADNIIFTSGGSEANNLAILGVRNHLERYFKKHIIVSAVEHHSIMSAVSSLKTHGFDISYVYPNKSGVVTLESVTKLVRKDTGLVCVMTVNNETGVVNQTDAIGEYCKHYEILFMTDCVQAAGSFPIHIGKSLPYCDFLTISSHKIHGPKGVGALYCRDLGMLEPIIYGGNEQEYGLRGGTENVPGIVGFGKAAACMEDGFIKRTSTILNLKSMFYDALIGRLPSKYVKEHVHVNGCQPKAYGKILNITFDGVDGETLLMLINQHGVCASAGSACNSEEQVPSHVLIAMGLSEEQARSSVRFSFSEMNKENEVVVAAKIVADAVCALMPGYMK